MKNSVEIEGVVHGYLPTAFYAKDQYRVQVEVSHGSVTGAKHRFLVELRGRVARELFKEYRPGSLYSFQGRLKASNMGKIKVIAHAFAREAYTALTPDEDKSYEDVKRQYDANVEIAYADRKYAEEKAESAAKAALNNAIDGAMDALDEAMDAADSSAADEATDQD